MRLLPVPAGFQPRSDPGLPAAGVSACLPRPRGRISGRLIACLRGEPDRAPDFTVGECADAEDLQLALFILYELHYEGFGDVAAEWEWSPALMELTRALEHRFEGELRGRLPVAEHCAPGQVPSRLIELVGSDKGPSLSRYAALNATLDQMREFLIIRSAYQLKEADPHTWAIPRLRGPAKAAMVEIQADEYGSGDPDRVHAELFAKAMRALGLDSRPNHYLDLIPGSALAGVNLMTMFGLHRRLRGAIVGHLAAFETTSSGPNRRYGNALRRLGLGHDAVDFFDEHVEADAIHENLATYDLAGGLAASEPLLADEILFGAAALLALDADLNSMIIDRWQRSETALLEPLEL